VTLAWPTFYRKDSLASGESHGIRFRHSAQKTKDPADAEHRPSVRESVALGRLCLHVDIAMRQTIKSHTSDVRFQFRR